MDRGTLSVNNCNGSLPDVGTHVSHRVGDTLPLFLKGMIISFPIIKDLMY